MTKHLVSIIIPVYNVSDYVEECLQSVAVQTYTHIECIIVDDCGTDDSMQKVEQFVTSYQGCITFKIFHHEHNRGLSAARNTGMDAATGDYIYFMDSDDYIYPNSIEVLVKAIEEEVDIDWSCGDYDNIPHRSLYKEGGIYKNALDLLGRRQLYPMAQNCLYKTTFLRGNNLYFKEGLIHEDNLWTFQVACDSRKLGVCNHATYFYRKRETSITTKPFPERYPFFFTIYQEYIRYATEHRLQNREDVFDCITRLTIHFFRVPLLRGYNHLSYDYYKVVRKNPYLGMSQIWSLTHSLKQVSIRIHRIFPPRIGYLYIWILYQPFNIKELLYAFFKDLCVWKQR